MDLTITYLPNNTPPPASNTDPSPPEASMKNSQGALDLKRWECMIPGRDKTIWEGALLKLEVQFPDGKITSV